MGRGMKCRSEVVKAKELTPFLRLSAAGCPVGTFMGGR